MADDDPSFRPFSFFDLPRELRNIIYRQLKLNFSETEIQECCYLNSSVETIAPHARRISRQFKRELGEEPGSTTTLSPWDAPDFDYYKPIPGEALIKSTTNLAIWLFAFCKDVLEGQCKEDCVAGGELRKHKSWIRGLVLRLPDLKAIHIYLTIEWSSQGEFGWPEAPHAPSCKRELSSVLEIEKLKSVHVYKMIRGPGEAAEHDQDEGKLWVS